MTCTTTPSYSQREMKVRQTREKAARDYSATLDGLIARMRDSGIETTCFRSVDAIATELAWKPTGDRMPIMKDIRELNDNPEARAMLASCLQTNRVVLAKHGALLPYLQTIGFLIQARQLTVAIGCGQESAVNGIRPTAGQVKQLSPAELTTQNKAAELRENRSTSTCDLYARCFDQPWWR